MTTNKDKKESKIKAHLNKHKKKYITGAVVVGVGTACFFIGKRYGSVNNLVDNSSVISNQAAVNYKPTSHMENTNNYITNVYNLSRPGNAGNIVYCPELDKTFASQTIAEKECGISKGVVSKILNGTLKQSVNGLTFKKIGDFNSDSPRLEEVNSVANS